MNKKLLLPLALTTLALTSTSFAREYPVGGPIERNGMEIAHSYLVGVHMMPMMSSMGHGEDYVHLEADVHATQDNKWGFSPDAWVPYMTLNYMLTKEGDKEPFDFGSLLPMTASDGPHYAKQVKMKGPGTYTVTFKYTAPDQKGFGHHTDKETGVPEWFKPFKESFTFKYPQK